MELSEGTIYLQRRKEIKTHHRSGRCSGIWTDIEFVQKQMIEDKIYSITKSPFSYQGSNLGCLIQSQEC